MIENKLNQAQFDRMAKEKNVQDLFTWAESFNQAYPPKPLMPKKPTDSKNPDDWRVYADALAVYNEQLKEWEKEREEILEYSYHIERMIDNFIVEHSGLGGYNTLPKSKAWAYITEKCRGEGKYILYLRLCETVELMDYAHAQGYDKGFNAATQEHEENE